MKTLNVNLIFKIKASILSRGPNFMLMEKQSRLDFRKYSFSQRIANVWNKLSTDFGHAGSNNVQEKQNSHTSCNSGLRIEC